MNKTELNSLLRYALVLCKNEHDAQDLLQSSLEKLYAKKINVTFPLRYVMKIMKNNLLNNIKKDRLLSFNSEIIDNCDGDLNFESELIQKIDIEVLLKTCSVQEKEILFLWAYEGMTYEEISVFLKIPKGTLLTQIHRLKILINKKFLKDDL